MKKSLFVILFSIGILVNAQVTKKGVALVRLAGYKKGDTLTVYGIKKDTYGIKYKCLVKHKRNSKSKYVLGEYVDIEKENLSFWDEVWFNEISGHQNVYNYSSVESMLEQDAASYIDFCLTNNLIYSNDFLNDYIYNLVQKIYPKELDQNNKYKNKVIIVDIDAPFINVFNLGSIVISTGYLANLNSEQELVKDLNEQILHAFLNHNVINIKKQEQKTNTASVLAAIVLIGATAAIIASANDDTNNEDYSEIDDYEVETSDYDHYDHNVNVSRQQICSNAILKSAGSNYSDYQNKLVSKYSNLYMNTIDSVFQFKSEKEFYSLISECITKTAWIAYHNLDNEKSLQLVNKLIDTELATEDDYLLKVKLNRRLFSSDEKHIESLYLIKKAKNVGLVSLIELDKEKALIYARLGKFKNSIESYKRYRDGLLIMKDRGNNVDEELVRVNEIIYRQQKLNE